MGNKGNKFFSKKQEQKIVEAIKQAELNSSGEIRIHVDFKDSSDFYERALVVFEQLEMHLTKDRNAVLFHLAPAHHKFTIIGDVGIDKVTPDNFWDEIKDEVISYFKTENYTKGLCKGIEMTGKALKTYFPYQNDDVNELPDEISYN